MINGGIITEEVLDDRHDRLRVVSRNRERIPHLLALLDAQGHASVSKRGCEVRLRQISVPRQYLGEVRLERLTERGGGKPVQALRLRRKRGSRLHSTASTSWRILPGRVW